MVLTGRLGVLESPLHDVLKARVHTRMRAQPVGKEKPRESGASYSQFARIMGFEFERQTKRSLDSLSLHGASVQLPHVR